MVLGVRGVFKHWASNRDVVLNILSVYVLSCWPVWVPVGTEEFHTGVISHV